MSRPQLDPEKIEHVYLWQNGMVMTFSEIGDQMPDYQGRLSAVREAILRDAGDSVVFHIGEWRGECKIVSRQQFADAQFTPPDFPSLN